MSPSPTRSPPCFEAVGLWAYLQRLSLGYQRSLRLGGYVPALLQEPHFEVLPVTFLAELRHHWAFELLGRLSRGCQHRQDGEDGVDDDGRYLDR